MSDPKRIGNLTLEKIRERIRANFPKRGVLLSWRKVSPNRIESTDGMYWIDRVGSGDGVRYRASMKPLIVIGHRLLAGQEARDICESFANAALKNPPPAPASVPVPVPGPETPTPGASAAPAATPPGDRPSVPENTEVFVVPARPRPSGRDSTAPIYGPQERLDRLESEAVHALEDGSLLEWAKYRPPNT